MAVAFPQRDIKGTNSIALFICAATKISRRAPLVRMCPPLKSLCILLVHRLCNVGLRIAIAR